MEVGVGLQAQPCCQEDPPPCSCEMQNKTLSNLHLLPPFLYEIQITKFSILTLKKKKKKKPLGYTSRHEGP